LLEFVQTKPLAQFAIAVQPPHDPVPLPMDPIAHVAQIRLEPLVTLHVSTTLQLVIVPQSVQVLLLSYVPTPHGVHVPVPSPT
jgi:hypothetical protein